MSAQTLAPSTAPRGSLTVYKVYCNSNPGFQAPHDMATVLPLQAYFLSNFKMYYPPTVSSQNT